MILFQGIYYWNFFRHFYCKLETYKNTLNNNNTSYIVSRWKKDRNAKTFLSLVVHFRVPMPPNNAWCVPEFIRFCARIECVFPHTWFLLNVLIRKSVHNINKYVDERSRIYFVQFLPLDFSLSPPPLLYTSKPTSPNLFRRSKLSFHKNSMSRSEITSHTVRAIKRCDLNLYIKFILFNVEKIKLGI